MEFPAIERTYSHISHRPPSETTPESSSRGSTPEHSPVEAASDVQWAISDTAPLTPVASRGSQLSRPLTRYTTQMTSDPAYEVDFDDDDSTNPRNWPGWYKAMVLFFLSISTLLIVLYSTSYTAAIPVMMSDLGEESTTIATLGLTTYLLGLGIGSFILAPLSETFGRKPIYLISLFIFTILIIPCALAKHIITLIVVRFFGALAGSAMIANAPGTITDIISDEYRAIAFSVWSIGPMNGPVFGPLFGGFVTEYLSWRWADWIIMMLGGCSFIMMCIVKETYMPVLLQKKAERARKETGDGRYWSRFDIKLPFGELMRVNLSRPFVMAVKEPICIFWNVYIGIIYAILYLCFSVYPIVYHEERGWSIGLSSLGFLGIGVGILITICLASPIKKMINAHKPDDNGDVPPESMMSVVCIAAILVPIGELWFAWTCHPASISPAASIAAGIPFGAGNAGIFIYASNYLVHSYGIYAASALAGNSVIRSVLGGVLPLAGPPLYSALGANWAGTFLGMLEVLIIPIPFIFYRYGSKIREKSKLIKEMREIEEAQEAKRKRGMASRALKLGASSQVRDIEKCAASSSDPSETAKATATNIHKTSKGIQVTDVTNQRTGAPLKVSRLDHEKQAEADLSMVYGLAKETTT